MDDGVILNEVPGKASLKCDTETVEWEGNHDRIWAQNSLESENSKCKGTETGVCPDIDRSARRPVWRAREKERGREGGEMVERAVRELAGKQGAVRPSGQ